MLRSEQRDHHAPFGLAFELHEGEEIEPTVLDLLVGIRAGLWRPHDVRSYIQLAIEERLLHEGEDFRRGAASHQSDARAEDEFWLTETGVLKLAMRLPTPAASALVDEMIQVVLGKTKIQ